jgi:hypothetical protein
LLSFVALGVDFNVPNNDTQIPLTFPPGRTRYKINLLVISGASGTLTTATCGLFTAAGGGGTAIIAGGTAITVTTAADATANNMQQISGSTIISATATPLFFRVGTAEGVPATANVELLVTFLP